MKTTTATNENIDFLPNDEQQEAYQVFSWLENELNLIDLKILRYLNSREISGAADANTAGFFVSEEEVRSFLISQGHHSNTNQDYNLNNKIQELENLKTNTISPLQMISEKLGLDNFERQILIMALALEVEKKYERIYAYFNDDLSKKAPSLDLTLRVFDPDNEEITYYHRYFSGEAPLKAYQLIRFVYSSDEESFLSVRFKLDEGIKDILLGIDTIHPQIKSLVRIEYPELTSGLSESKIKTKNELRKILANTYENESKGLAFWMYGKSGIEKRTIVTALCAELEIPLIIGDLEDILTDQDSARTIKLIFRDAVLNSSALFLKGGDILSLDEEKRRLFQRLFLKVITEFTWFVFIDGHNFWSPDEFEEALHWCPIEVKEPSFFERRDIWTSLLHQDDVSPEYIDAVASRFIFDENQIAKAVNYINIKCNGSKANFDSLLQACSFQSPKKLPTFTKKITPHYKWDDLVLPKDKLQHLKEVCGFLKNKHQVYYNWGFDKKLSLGRGLNILFTGPSGTGKTMTAEILADELQLDLYKTELSSIVSKYIGETEKNLEKIFDATSSGNAILFFDEADALFGKRSEVKDAHDRFANIETNYLLQRIEEHEGVVILSTNLSKNMDDAFLRRMQFTVEFPFPNKKYREIIWKKVFPEASPLSEKIDYQFLAKKLEISGGNIKNIALASAFLAADQQDEIKMENILHATKREYQKIGKTFVKSDFTAYSEMLESGSA